MPDTEPWGPDAYLDRAKASLVEAEARYKAFTQKAEDARAHGAAPDLMVEESLWRDFESKRKAYEHAANNHPTNFMSRISEEASQQKAPELSTFQWLYKNPGMLTARPKSQEQRDSEARLMFLAEKVKEQAAKFPQGHELNPWNASGDAASALQGLMAEAEMLDQNPGRRSRFESPYNHRKFNHDEDGNLLPLDQQIWEPLHVADAAYGGLRRWKDNFVHAGKRLAEGSPLEALGSAAAAFPGLVSPAFHRGEHGSDTDWRPAAGGYATPIDLGVDALTLRWNGRSAFRRPGSGLMPGAQGGAPSALTPEQLDDLRRAFQSASKRTHPDLGGSEAAQRAVNAAYESGDFSALQRLSSPRR